MEGEKYHELSGDLVLILQISLGGPGSMVSHPLDVIRVACVRAFEPLAKSRLVRNRPQSRVAIGSFRQNRFVVFVVAEFFGRRGQDGLKRYAQRKSESDANRTLNHEGRNNALSQILQEIKRS